ncbi:MAG: CRISPR-associated protein Crm3 [Myxococcota bacterium]|nr:CRISPR-associated protein Crm3 [Myxococcota bacterium]MDW8363846.1 type III-B CRISPR module-associated Cmr3 family protein [Myxococcales bacterium]
MTTVRIALVPRDGLFCKDGRGWYTSASGRGHGLDWPWPSTILGALRSSWGRAEESRKNAFFGPDDWSERTAAIQLGRTLVLRRKHDAAWRAEDAIWPVPLDALWLEGRREVHRLDPVEPTAPTLGRDDDEARERLWRPVLEGVGKPLAAPRWWSSDDFSAWLAGRSVAVRDRREVLTTARRVQVHVGIRPDELTANDGVLFSHDVIETLDPHGEWAIGAELTLPDGALGDVATLGSDGRLARLESLPAAVFEPPAVVLEAFRSPSRGLRLVAVTPLCFTRGWLPDGLAEHDGTYRGRVPGLEHDVILRAAFVPRPVHVSGWNMAARAPKPTSRMVAPGAVYFFERADGRPFGEADARALWLAAVGTRTEEGFGRVVPGVWTPARSKP